MTAIDILRNKKIDTATFRRNAHHAGQILARDLRRKLDREMIGSAPITLIPILRSGLALLPAFLEVFIDAKVGFIGLKRNEKTFKPKSYYKHLPSISKKDIVIILDPMLATGSSAVAAIKALIKTGVREKQIIFVGVISAPEGLKKLAQHFPSVTTFIAAHDKKLDKHKYIVPGLGDFGDRYFGTR